MTSQLVTVYKNDGTNGEVLSLDTTEMLINIREILQKEGFMNAEDSFLLDGNPLRKKDEAAIPLSELLGHDKKLYVGGSTLGPISPDHAIAAWKDLSEAQVKALFNNIEIFRGISIKNSNEFHKSFSDIVSWDTKSINTVKPRIITEVTSDYEFSSMTKELNTFGIKKASVSFSSPWASAKAEYEHEKKKTTTSKEVTIYLVGKYILRKIAVEAKPQDMIISECFLNAVKEAVRNNKDTVDGYVNLINVLNEYGYYIPSSFTLGGVLYSTSSTEISEFSQAESEKQSFSFGFNATFKGIGGGAAYSNASGSDQKTGQSSKFENQTLQQIGGIGGTSNDYDKWVVGLDQAVNWDVASYEKLIPSIALIGMANQSLGNICTNLLSKYFTYASVKEMQSVVDMGDYAKQAKQYFVNPF